MMTKQSIGYRAFLVSAAFVMFATGWLHGGVALAAGGNDIEVDFNDLIKMSEAWLLASDGNEPNEPVVSDVNLTPAGGLFELPGGLVIDAPFGAVNEPTSFQIRLLDANEVEPYLDIGQAKKSFMGGFEIISDGIVFNVPIFVQFPIIPLQDPNSLPHVYYLNKEDGTLIPDLPEPEDTNSSEPVLYSLLAASPAENGTSPAENGVMYDPRNAVAEFMISITPPERRSQMLIELYDVLGHSDCVANPCRCMRQFVTSHSADLVSANKCSKVSEIGSIQFPDCEGQPNESWDMEHESIQIAVTLNPDRRAILCEGSLTMTVNVFGIDGKRMENYEVKATSSRPDLLEVTSFGGGLFSLDRVGEDTGMANVVIDAGCEITRTVPIKVGCKIPDLTGSWVVNGFKNWWGCQDEEDDGTYTGPYTVEFDSQVKLDSHTSRFAGTFEYTEFTEDYTLYYTEDYVGEISVDCEVTDHCAYKVSGSTNYTEKYYFPDSEPDEPPYIIKGIDTFSGYYSQGVITLTTLGMDTSGDTCQTAGSATFRR
jgi:hypothetical protein